MLTLKRILLFIGLKIVEIGGVVSIVYLIKHFGWKTVLEKGLIILVCIWCILIVIFGIYEISKANWNYVKKKIK